MTGSIEYKISVEWMMCGMITGKVTNVSKLECLLQDNSLYTVCKETNSWSGVCMTRFNNQSDAASVERLNGHKILWKHYSMFP